MRMKNKPDGTKYKCVFFDLDHTLWDFEANARETLLELYNHHSLVSRGVGQFDAFFMQFRAVNLSLWDQFDRGLIDNMFIRRERFKRILESFNAYEEKLSQQLTEHFLTTLPLKCNLIPRAIEILDYLAERYNLTVITNGLDEIQNRKMSSGNLHGYFDHIITSQRTGHRKPEKEIFEYALQVNAVKAGEAIMIGDNLIADIGGARNASIDSVFLNRDQLQHTAQVDYEISCLGELREIL